MKYLTTICLICTLASCTPAFAADPPVCNETYADVVEFAATEGLVFSETNAVVEAITLVENIYGPAPDDIINDTVLIIGLSNEPMDIVGFVNASDCVIAHVYVPHDIYTVIFG